MLDTFDHRYTTNTGRLIFVPSNAGRTDGEKVIRRVLKRWAPPKHFYHLRDGGHIAAMRAHLANTIFVTMDLQGFFDSITRTKVHRAMRSIGYGQRVALEVAQRATVWKPGLSGYSLPYGFVQSPILASVVLGTSALGRALRDLGAHSITVSVYMDDILLSGRDTAALSAARDELAEAARVAGLSFNLGKSAGPALTARMFNLILSHGTLEIAPDRLSEFEASMASAGAEVTQGILSYVSGVNEDQHDHLAALVK